MKALYLTTPTKPEFDITINNILQGKEYTLLKNPVADFIEKIRSALRDWFFNFLKNTFSGLKAPGVISDRLSSLFMIAGMLILSTLIILIIVRISKAFNRNASITEILGEKIDEKTTPLTLREKAASFEREGDLRQAIRFDFIAALLLMHNERIIFLDETKTNREIYEYLNKNKFPWISPFKFLENTFDHCWYGHKSCSKADYANWRANLNELWNGVMKK